MGLGEFEEESKAILHDVNNSFFPKAWEPIAAALEDVYARSFRAGQDAGLNANQQEVKRHIIKKMNTFINEELEK